jgi:CspA family cold shock protein
MNGKIKMWNENRGWGFIIPDDGGDDLFVHVSNVRSGAEIKRGCAVTFEIGTNERTGRPEARNVVLK